MSKIILCAFCREEMIELGVCNSSFCSSFKETANQVLIDLERAYNLNDL